MLNYIKKWFKLFWNYMNSPIGAAREQAELEDLRRNG